MNSESSLKIKILMFSAAMALVGQTTAHADPVIAGEILPPASARLITDLSLIEKIDLGDDLDPIWCYSTQANAILITSPQREREKCRLSTRQQEIRLNALHKLRIDVLNAELNSLKSESQQVLQVKQKEIQDLTEAALKRPNDYSLWWATGGYLTGALTVVTILWITK